MRLREEVATRCTKKIKRRVLKKQTRKARAEHLVRVQFGGDRKEKIQRKQLSEPHVKGTFTEDSEEWKKELQRHCEEVYHDQDETREVQEQRIEYFRKRGDRQFTDDGRRAVITVDLVLQAGQRCPENKVNGPGDAVVSEMIKQLPLEKIYIITLCFQERLLGQMEAPSSWKIEIGVLTETGCRAKEGDQKLQSHSVDIGDVEVVRVLNCSSSRKRKRT